MKNTKQPGDVRIEMRAALIIAFNDEVFVDKLIKLINSDPKLIRFVKATFTNEGSVCAYIKNYEHMVFSQVGDGVVAIFKTSGTTITRGDLIDSCEDVEDVFEYIKDLLND